MGAQMSASTATAAASANGILRALRSGEFPVRINREFSLDVSGEFSLRNGSKGTFVESRGMQTAQETYKSVRDSMIPHFPLRPEPAGQRTREAEQGPGPSPADLPVSGVSEP